jgi:hypothetical protein
VREGFRTGRHRTADVGDGDGLRRGACRIAGLLLLAAARGEQERTRGEAGDAAERSKSA